MTTPKSDLPQGTLDLLILKIVALGPLHGYAIAQRLQQISRDVVQVPQGSLYPALHRLENRSLLVAEWKLSDTGRDAKFYRLTRKGRAQMQEETDSWHRLTAAIGLILALMVLRFIAERAHRTQVRYKAELRRRQEASRAASPEAKTAMVTTLEVDPDTGIYRPKG